MDNQSKTLKETVVLGLFFLLMVTTYASFSHIVNYISEHSEEIYPFEGEIVLILNYIVYLLGLARAPSLKNYKKQFLIAAACYSINYSLYLFRFNKIFGLIAAMVGAIVGGFGASVLWVCQGGYMMKLFKQYQIQQHHEGYYLGIQNGLVYGSQLLGAVIITFGLGFLGDTIYFLILTIIGVLAFVLCWLFLDPLDQSQREIAQIQAKPQTARQIWENLKEVARFYPTMKYLFAALMLDGLMLGIVASYFSHFIPEQIRSANNVGVVLMINGLGAIIGGYLSGYLSDKIIPAKLGIAGLLFIIFTFLLTLLVKYLVIQTLTYPCILGFLWGVCLYFLEGWIFVCCAKVYQGRIQSFAIVKQIHTITFIIFQISMIAAKNQINIVVYLVVLIFLACCGICSCRLMEKKDKKQKKHEEFVEETSPPQQ